MRDKNRHIFLILRTQQVLLAYMKKEMKQNRINISPAQSSLLFLLLEKNLRTMSELSSKLGIDNSTITGLVDRLEREEYVVRESNPKDRRKNLIKITDKGATEAKRAAKVINRINKAIEDGFSIKEIEAFKTVMFGLIDKFEV